MIYTIWLQRKELRLQREELALTRQELKRQAEAQEVSGKALAEQVKSMQVSAKLNALNALLRYRCDIFVASWNTGMAGGDEDKEMKRIATQIEEVLKDIQ